MLDYTHLEALLSVEREGSFEGAARSLGLTPIGVARRVKKLEARMGTDLLARKPTRPTEAGQALCRFTEEIADLEKQFFCNFGTIGSDSTAADSTFKIAIDNDSLSCWFLLVLQEHAKVTGRPLYDIALVDQDHSIDPMKNGLVVAGISSRKQPVHGFKCFHLGHMSYRAIASPAFKQRHFAKGVTLETVSAVPCLKYSVQDGLLLQWLEQVFGKTTRIRPTRLPSAAGLLNACLLDTAWGMAPEFEIGEHLANGKLVELLPDTPLRKNLYWHVSSAHADTISDMTASVRNTAGKHLKRSVVR